MSKKIAVVGLAVGLLFSGSVLAEESKLGYQGEEVISLMGDVWDKAKNSQIIHEANNSGTPTCQAHPEKVCYRFHTGRMGIDASKSYTFKESGLMIFDQSKDMSFHPDKVGYEIYYIENVPNLYAFTEFGVMHIFNNGLWVEKGPWVKLAASHLMTEINRLDSIEVSRKKNFKDEFADNATRPGIYGVQKTVQNN